MGAITTFQPQDPLDPVGPWEDLSLKVSFVLEGICCCNICKLLANNEGDASD